MSCNVLGNSIVYLKITVFFLSKLSYVCDSHYQTRVTKNVTVVVVLNETKRWCNFRSHLLRCRPHVIRALSGSTYEADAVISPFENKVWESTKV